MKKFLIILGIFISLACFSEEIIINENDFNVNVISSDDHQTVIEYDFGRFEIIPVEINGEIFYQLKLERESETYEKGSPELPKITRSIIIPDNAKVRIDVIEKDFVEYQMRIIPSKGILSREINPEDIPYEFSDIYQQNEIYPLNNAELGSPYIMRDFRGITVNAYPFVYNPITQTLRVYHHLVLEVNNIGTDTENIKIRTSDNINKYFSEIYQNHFINFSRDRYTSVYEQGRMIVICYGSFMTNIQPYVDWKIQKGINTELHNVSDIGTTATDIMNFIQSEYDENNGLTFVQLVGDDDEIPYFTHSCLQGNDAADPKYSLLEGSDNYPEIFIGRFSAETTSQVDTQVERSIEYERDINSGSWLHKGMGVASDQGTGDDGEYDDEHIDNIRADLLGYTYTEVDQIYDPSGTSAQVSAGLNAGRSIINYCGHGSSTSWSTTGFNTTNINALTNDNMLPFICSVACLNGNFTGYTCFAEAWLRATNGSNPTGAISIYASTINQSWSPPMSAQDEVADLLCGTGPYAGTGNQKNSIGGLMYNGSCLMMDEYFSAGEDMFLTWHIFGDASLQVRTDTPSTMTISHNANILVGQTSFDVSTGVEDALACLYDGTNIVGSGYTNSSGNVTITLDPAPTSPGNLTLTITAYNKTTSVEIIPVIANAEPDILVNPTFLTQELEPDQSDSQTFDITNNGDQGTTLTYNITWEYTTARSLEILQQPDDMPDYEWERLYRNTGFRDETWLDVAPISGDCTYNESDLITADFNSAGMTEGTYSATITISNNAGADEYVYVTLDVETTGGTPVNPRAIAEFESMEGVLVRYPFGVPVSLIAEMSEDVMVTTIVANAGEEATVTSTYSSNGVNMANCNFEYSPTNTYWIRDYGPWWVEDGSDDVAITDYTYNRPRPDDNDIPGEMATFLSENLYLMGLEHTGGNYMTDGMGIAVSTDLIWDENSSLSHTEIEQRMQDYLGIQTYHVVADPNGDYIRHVDCWGKFLDVDKLLIREVPASHSQYDEIESVVDYFEAQTSSYGTPYEIYRVYTPNDEPYTNSFILNDKVFVPTMSSSWDDDAIALYESAMPGYEVLGFYDSDWQSTDAIHCRLRETANREMLYINHIPISGTVLNRANYEINATIIPYSGQPVYNDSLLVYYKVDGGVYASVPMISTGGNNYQGIIPEQASGSEIAYYIHTVDQSGQSANHPFIGAFDPHIFDVSGQPGVPVNVQIQIVSGNVQLSWDAVTGATSYKVYSSDNPYTGFVEDTSGSFAGESWSASIINDKKFYRVTAEN
jgi:agmatine/peptidylarginine deiminase